MGMMAHELGILVFMRLHTELVSVDFPDPIFSVNLGEKEERREKIENRRRERGENITKMLDVVGVVCTYPCRI
jgi:hypothetical protein